MQTEGMKHIASIPIKLGSVSYNSSVHFRKKRRFYLPQKVNTIVMTRSPTILRDQYREKRDSNNRIGIEMNRVLFM